MGPGFTSAGCSRLGCSMQPMEPWHPGSGASHQSGNLVAEEQWQVILPPLPHCQIPKSHTAGSGLVHTPCCPFPFSLHRNRLRPGPAPFSHSSIGDGLLSASPPPPTWPDRALPQQSRSQIRPTNQTQLTDRLGTIHPA